MALQVPHANPTVNAGLHQGEDTRAAHVSGEGPSRYFVLETCWALNTTLWLPSRGRLWCQSWLWHSSSMEPGKRMLCCEHHTHLPAGLYSICRRNQSCQRLLFAEGPKPGLAISLRFCVTTHAMLFPMLMNFVGSQATKIKGRTEPGSWGKKALFPKYMYVTIIYERVCFLKKKTLKLRFIHLSAFYLEALINDFFAFKYYQSKKTNRTGIQVLQARWVYTNVHTYIGRKKYPI